MSSVHPPLQWQVVLPVKGAPSAKSRLVVGPGVSRAALARAMALDTLAAALATPSVGAVLVVTSDADTAQAADRLGALVAPDPGLGLDGAVVHGAELARRRGAGPVAALLADLPALRPADLQAALDAAAAHPAAYVPDAEGSGTVLLTASEPGRLQPAFGEGSAARHDLVADRLDLDRPRLRRDVDVQAALREALALGVGTHTAAVLAGADTRWLA